MSTMHQNLFAAAARFVPWSGLLRHLPQFPHLAFSRDGVHNQADTPACTRPTSAPACVARPTPARRSTSQGATRQRASLLRVIHIMEPGTAAAPVGRLLMSGRMADVCAELDRMVEREAAQLARS
jgi:hypothetical protein